MIDVIIFGAGTVTGLVITATEVSFDAGTVTAQPLRVIVYDKDKLLHEYHTKKLANSFLRNGQRVIIIWSDL